jgi:CRISPR system Cascade subunit CasD
MSFGCYSKGYDRDTNEFPTRSAIYGIILCSMGKKGKMPEMFKKLNNIKMDIYSYTETSLEKDFQTIGCGYDKETYQYKFLKTCDGSNSTTGSKVFYKHYLSNQHFRVVLEIVDDDFANEIANYLKKSVWQPYFGRKNVLLVNQFLMGFIIIKKKLCLLLKKIILFINILKIYQMKISLSE